MKNKGVDISVASAPPPASTTSRRVLLSLWMGGVFGQEVVEGLHEWLRESGASWSIRFADSEKLFDSSMRWMLKGGRLDGVISIYHSNSLLALLRRARVPFVKVDPSRQDDPLPPIFRSPGIACVECDMEAVARTAADHLLSRAEFRSAGYVESYFDHGWSRHRGDAVIAEFARRGIPVKRFLHYGKPSPVVARHGPDFDNLALWLRTLDKPAAIVAANDYTAVEVIRICEMEGIAVPRDIAVLGMDDNPVFCQHCEPNLSSIHFDGRRAGRLCAQALAAMMAGNHAPPHEFLRYGALTIAKRASTAATPSIGEIVQRALDYIDANACAGATLSDVVRHCCYSRTLVSLRFRQMTGKSVEQAIRTRRLDEARRLLRETHLSAEEIAPRCGYESISALRRAFVRSTGLTMGAWRRAYGNAEC